MHEGRHRSGTGLWATAFVVTLGLHLGVAALSFANFAATPPPDDGGYIAIDLVAPPTAPMVDQPDMPVGPESPEVAAQMEASTPPTPAVPDDTPPVPAAKADEAMVKDETPPVPPEQKPPEDVKPDPTQHVELQTEATAPSEAMAPPKIEAPRSDHPAAPPIVGKSDADIQERITWVKLLGVHLDRNKRFPVGQHADRKTIEVKLRFQLAADGRVLSVRVVSSSGNAAFDEAALATMKRASPVPAPPPSLLAQTSVFNIPVVFHAKE